MIETDVSGLDLLPVTGPADELGRMVAPDTGAKVCDVGMYQVNLAARACPWNSYQS
jgi:hypothetical protein